MNDYDEDEGEMCPKCGEIVDVIEIEMHGGVCKCCYDDNHFGDPDFEEVPW